MRSNRFGLDAVDLLVQAERLGGGQVPPELVFLAHHQGEAAAIGVFAPPGHEAHHAGSAAGGRNHAGEEFQRGGLARPVGAQEGDELALFDLEVDAADRLDQSVPPAKQPADGRAEPFLLLVNAIGLRQPFDFDDRHDGNIILQRLTMTRIFRLRSRKRLVGHATVISWKTY